MTDAETVTAVAGELYRARLRHGNLHSHHEAFAVIAEELDEYWEWVRKRTGARDRVAIQAELIQIAAMACRAAVDCEDFD